MNSVDIGQIRPIGGPPMSQICPMAENYKITQLFKNPPKSLILITSQACLRGIFLVLWQLQPTRPRSSVEFSRFFSGLRRISAWIFFCQTHFRVDFFCQTWFFSSQTVVFFWSPWIFSGRPWFFSGRRGFFLVPGGFFSFPPRFRCGFFLLPHVDFFLLLDLNPRLGSPDNWDLPQPWEILKMLEKAPVAPVAPRAPVTGTIYIKKWRPWF